MCSTTTITKRQEGQVEDSACITNKKKESETLQEYLKSNYPVVLDVHDMANNDLIYDDGTSIPFLLEIEPSNFCVALYFQISTE